VSPQYTQKRVGRAVTRDSPRRAGQCRGA